MERIRFPRFERKVAAAGIAVSATVAAAGAVAADDAAIVAPPVEVTACVLNGPPAGPGSDEETTAVSLPDGEMTIFRSHGAWQLNVSEVSDPRLDGTWILTADFAGSAEFEIVSGTYRIENDEGAWQGSDTFLRSDDEFWDFALIGEGAYEGLTAIMNVHQDRSPCPNTRGFIFEGSVPPPPVPYPVVDADTRVGFVGLPPVGATPSTPERGELVVYVAGPDRRSRTWVYADGRLIWHRHANLPEGANSQFTGFLEQRLTPEGVELMRSEVASLLDDERAPDTRQECWWALCQILVRNDGVVPVPWPGDDSEVLERVTHPESWLPASAWDDPEIRAYVPSRYRVDFDPHTVARLPQAAQVLLDDHILTTDELRAIVEILDGARLPFAFEPVLPHGQAYCQHCG